MNPIIGGMKYFDRAIDRTMPAKISVVDLTPRPKKIMVRRKMSPQEERHYESIIGHDEPEEINDLGSGGEPLDPVPF